MSTLEELRRTMDRHADDIHDDAVHARAAVVRRRGRQVRRQRRAVAGIATVAAAAAVVALVALPGGRSPQPADRMLLGMEAPATMTSLGYTYDFSRGITGDATGTTVTLGASDTSRLITWADRGDGTIRIHTADDRTLVSRGDFDDFTTVPPGQSGTWRIKGSGTAAVVYDLAPEEGIVYRSDVLGSHLVSSLVSPLGWTHFSGSVQLPAGRIAFSSFCTGGDEHTWFHAKVVGGSGSFGANCTAPVFDPGGHAESLFRWKSAGSTTVRLWATDGEHGPRITDPDMQIGYGLYAMKTRPLDVAGFEVEQQVEYDGHVWGLPRSVESRPGDRTLRTIGFDRGTELVVAAFSHTGGPVYTSLAGVDGAAFSGTRLGGSTTLGTVGPGSKPSELRIRGTLSPRALLGFVYYQRLD